MTKDKVVRCRIEQLDYDKLEKYAEAYDEDISSVLRRIIKALPSNPPNIPKPKITLE